MVQLKSYIHIDNIRMHANHGVMPQERVTGNDYDISVRVQFDVSRAMRSDYVGDTLNYADVYNAIKAQMDVPSNLVEHVAGRTVRAIMDMNAGITAVDLRITKLNPPMGADCRGAGVEIHVER